MQHSCCFGSEDWPRLRGGMYRDRRGLCEGPSITTSALSHDTGRGKSVAAYTQVLVIQLVCIDFGVQSTGINNECLPRGSLTARVSSPGRACATSGCCACLNMLQFKNTSHLVSRCLASERLALLCAVRRRLHQKVMIGAHFAGCDTGLPAAASPLVSPPWLANRCVQAFMSAFTCPLQADDVINVAQASSQLQLQTRLVPAWHALSCRSTLSPRSLRLHKCVDQKHSHEATAGLLTQKVPRPRLAD